MQTGSDRELLVGVMSVQLGFASAQQVMTSAAEWATDRTRSLAELMQTRGILSATQRQMLEALVSQAIQVNQGDVQRTLMSLGGERVLQSLGGSLISPKPPGDPGSKVSAQDDDERTDPHRHSEEDLIAVSEEDVGRYTDPDGQEETEIGRGGIGRVLIVRDHFLERDVAIKELLPSRSSGSGNGTPHSRTSAKGAPVVQRFLREARVTGKLEHPNIVPVYELGRRKDGTLYYSMKLVRGRTLAAAMTAAKALTDRLSLLPHFLGICHALAYAHSRGVIHRDIKPQNVMVGEFGETVVLDWGLAKVRGRKDLGRGDLKKDWVEMSGAHSIEGSAIGTPAYMSPEQAEGKVDDIDERSDVWSLGAMLYEVLTGKPPFEGVNPFDVIGKLLQDPVKPVNQVATDVPKELAAIADKALQREKALRYQSAKEFADDLNAFLTGKRVSAHDYTSMQLVKRFARRHRVSLSIVTVALLVVQVTAITIYREVKKERDNARHFAQLLISDVSKQLETMPGSGPLLDQLTSSALDFYRRSVDPSSSPLDERLELAGAYSRISEVALQAGKYKEAIEAGRFSAEIYRKALTERPQDAAIWRQYGGALIREADGHYVWTSAGVNSKATYEAALEAVQKANTLVPGDPETIDTLTRAYSRLGEVSQSEGELESSLRYYELAYETDKTNATLQQSHPDRYYRGLAIDLGMLGTLSNEFGNFAQAETWLRQAVEIEEHLVAAAPGNKDHKVNLAIDKGALATVFRNQGKLDDYKTQITAATEVMRPLLEKDNSRQVLDTWARLMSIQYDYKAALTTLEKVAQVTGTEASHAEIVEVALRSGDAKKAIEYAKRIEPNITLGTQRTETLAAYAAALAVEGDVVNARLMAKKAAESAALHGGTALDRGDGAGFMPELTHARAAAVRTLFDDLAAMKGKRDKEGWTRATNAFVRALSETP